MKAWLIALSLVLVFVTGGWGESPKSPPYASWETAIQSFTPATSEDCGNQEIAILAFDRERGWSLIAIRTVGSNRPSLVIMGPNTETWSILASPGDGNWKEVWGPFPDAQIEAPTLCGVIARARALITPTKL